MMKTIINSKERDDLIESINELTYLCDQLDPFNMNLDTKDDNDFKIHKYLIKHDFEHLSNNPFQITSAILRKLDLLKDKLEQLEYMTDLNGINHYLSKDELKDQFINQEEN